MPKGPHEARLDTYVTHGDSGTIGLAATTWGTTAGVLQTLAMALDSAKPHLLDRFGPKTGAAAVKAFEAVRKNVMDQAELMTKAESALSDASAALSDAVTLHRSLQGSSMGPEPQAPTKKAGESHQDFALRQQDASKAHSAYAAEYDRRETESAHKTTEVDKHYTAAVKVMEQIHGNPDTPSTAGGGGGGGSTTGGMPGSTGGHLPAGGGSHPNGGNTGHTTIGDPHTTTTHHHGHTVVPPYVPPTGGDPPGTDGGGDPIVYGDPGETQGPGYPGSTAASPGSLPGPSGTTSGANGTTGSLPGSSVAVGGVLGGGLLGGASGLSGALRGASATSGALAEEGVLGTSSRASGASSGALGRGGAVGGSGSSSSRSSGSGRGGGGRGAGGGGGAGGRGNKKDKKGKKPGVDFFEDNDGWLDDDEPAPAVLD